MNANFPVDFVLVLETGADHPLLSDEDALARPATAADPYYGFDVFGSVSTSTGEPTDAGV
jgi:hypothetical protein